jgi:uncharacterized protein involved in exopolysaccharide biosynthesis
MATKYTDTEQDAREQQGESEGGGFDLDRLKRILGFFVRAPRRRPKVAILTLVTVIALAVTAAAVMPRTYTVEMRVLAQSADKMVGITNPGRSIPRDVDNPTKNVADSILRHDNLLALAKQIDLVDRWAATRSGPMRFKDRMMASMFGAPSDEDRLNGLIYTLERKLTVTADTSSITISLDWDERQMAYDLVVLVEKNFVDARYDSDVAVINEAIEILEQRAKEQAAEVDAALAELQKIDEERRQKIVGLTTASPPPPPPSPAPGGPAPVRVVPAPAVTPVVPAAAPVDTTEDVARLEQVRARIRDLENAHKQRLADAQRQLDDARVTLGPMHPTVQALNQKIEQLAEPPPELTQLKAEERELVTRLAMVGKTAPSATGPVPVVPAGGGGGGAPRPNPASTAARTAAAAQYMMPSPQDDPQLSPAASSRRSSSRSSSRA